MNTNHGHTPEGYATFVANLKAATRRTLDTEIAGGLFSPAEIAEVLPLVTAAPELLAACERAINLVAPTIGPPMPLEPWAEELVAACRAAIAKAKGESK